MSDKADSEKVILEGENWGFHPPIEIEKDTLNEVYAQWLKKHGLLTPEIADTIRYAMAKAAQEYRVEYIAG